jgi:hypothetical protein
MAVLRLARRPEATTALYDAITSRLDLDEHPPEGLIMHTVCELDGVLTVVEVWLSEQHADRWDREHRIPAVEGISGSKAEPVASHSVHNLVVPAWRRVRSEELEPWGTG